MSLKFWGIVGLGVFLLVAAAAASSARPQAGQGIGRAAAARRETVDRLVSQAVAKLASPRGDQQEALRLLRQALRLGGAKDANWHAAFAVLGLRIKAPDNRVATSCLAALRLDPKNELAQRVLFELTKRQVMARGRLNPNMGRRKDRPIRLTGLFAEEYAYLVLLGVKSCGDPVVSPDKTLAAYVCRSRAGKVVTYYFDRRALPAPSR